MLQDMPWRSLRATAKGIARSKLDLTVEGTGNIPASGPGVIAGRHYHHLHDGVIVLATVPRPVHALAAVDWIQSDAGKTGMGAACRAARWPTVIRVRDGATPDQVREASRHLRHAFEDAIVLFREGRLLAVFPEGYPNIDPGYTPKTGDEFLPFKAGFARIAQAGARALGQPVPVIPTGFRYERGERWRVTVRYGEPIPVGIGTEIADVVAQVERQVRELSA